MPSTPNSQRDLLIRIGIEGLAQPRRTDDILDELGRALVDGGRVPPSKFQTLRRMIADSVPDCMITDDANLVEAVKLPDADDRHVLAAAIRAGAGRGGAATIVTNNLSDFPDDMLGQWNIAAESPDDFVMNLIDLDDRVVYSCVQQIAASRTKPPQSIEDVLRQLERSGLTQSVAELRLGRP